MTWPLGISTGVAWRRPIEEVLEKIRSAGFVRIEVATALTHFDVRDRSRGQGLVRLVSSLGLEVVSLHAPFGRGLDLTDPDVEFRRRTFDVMLAAADRLAELSGSLLVVHPGGEDHDWVFASEERIGRSIATLSRLQEECGRRGVRLVIETPLPHLCGGRSADFERIVSAVPDAGICVDTSHCGLGRSLPGVIDRAGPRLLHVQASDNRGDYDDHLPPGEGVLDWTGIAAALTRVGYAGTFLLELAGDDDVEASLARAREKTLTALPELAASIGGGPSRLA